MTVKEMLRLTDELERMNTERMKGMYVMKEYYFDELGYFTERDIQRLAARLNGKTFMRFQMDCANCAGNCTLIVKTDYDAQADEIKQFFLSFALRELAK